MGSEAETGVARQEHRGTVRRLFAFIAKFKGQFAFALVAMGIYGATDGAVPILIRSVLDNVFGNKDEHMLYLLPGIIIVFAVFRGAVGFFQNYLAASVGLGIVRELRDQIGSHLLRLSPAFFEKHQTGSLISRVTNDTLLVRFALTDSVAAVLRDAIRVVALLCAALYLDPVLALIAFIGFPLGMYPVIRFGKKVRKLSRIGQDQFGGLTGILQENILGHKIVQSFSNEAYEVERFEQENARLTKTFLKAEKYGALSGPTNEIVASFAIAGVILYGGLSVMGGVRTQGDFIAFITSMFLLYEPLKKLGRANTTFQQGVAAGERIFEVLDAVPEIAEMPGARALPPSGFDIKYEGVWFQYTSNFRGAEVEPSDAEGGLSAAALELGELRQWALEDVSLAVKEGETLALVGMSGGGKSTLVNLLPRFYDPQRGRILVGGLDVREAKLDSLRGAIAVVSQHTFLFNDTVFHNIRYGRLGATEQEVIDAAKAANAHDFILRLPEGYSTTIGEQGLKLSGGERARIAIARALLKNAPILVLDEATASLDSESEALVQAAIDRLMEKRTVFVIAHRLATIRKANRIAVVVNGRVVEYGTHEELLAAAGEYAKLYAIQFRAHSESGAEPAVLQ